MPGKPFSQSPVIRVGGYAFFLMAWLMPTFSGLVYGSMAYFWALTAVILTVYLIFSKKTKARRWLGSIGLFLFLLSICDLSLNALRHNRNQRGSLFRDTQIPYLQTYLPDTVAEVSLLNCNQEAVELYGDDCETFRFTTDKFGFRNPGFAAGDSLDVLFLGDSFGSGVCEDSATIPAKLAAFSGQKIYNLSISGTGPWEQVQHLRRELPRMKLRKNARLIWLVFPANDLDGYFGEAIPDSKPSGFRVWREGYRLFRFRSPLRYFFLGTLRKIAGLPGSSHVELRTFPDQKEGIFTKIYTERMLREAEEIKQHPNWEEMKNQFLEGLKLAREAGLKPSVYLLPAKGEVYEWILDKNPPWSFSSHTAPISQELKLFFSKENVPCTDIRHWLTLRAGGYFKETGNLFYWHSDTHLTPDGNQLVALKMYRDLYQQGNQE